MTTREKALSLYSQGLRCSAIARQLGVSRQRVGYIVAHDAAAGGTPNGTRG